MCVYVGSEVLLANLLSHRSSVSSKEIESYCEKLKEIFSNEMNINNIYLDSNDRTLETALARYEGEFRQFQGRFYRNQTINIRHFNDRFDEEISSTFRKAAQAMLVSE